MKKITTNMNRDYVFLLSGGLDSSLVCAIAQEIHNKLNKGPIKTFTIGILDDPDDDTKSQNNTIEDEKLPEDIIAARKVSKHIGSNHHELFFSMRHALETIPDVIETIESWDQTTVRASTPMYLGVQKIKELYPNTAVIFSGEVADELLQGYLYNHCAPSAQAGREDSINLLKNIHTTDGQRVDRIFNAFGCEGRFPFFDKYLLTFVLLTDPRTFNPQDNQNIEKYVLRKAFENMLPEDIIWRTKQALSDASSKASSWKDTIKATIPDEDKYYMQCFNNSYEGYWDVVPRKWMPPKDWIDAEDSSAATLKLNINFRV